MRAKSSNEKHKKIILNKNKIFYTSFLILALTGYKVGPILALFPCFDSSERS